MGAPLLLSSRLPLIHGFSTRQGGCSAPPWDSLNLGFSVGDAAERVEENLRRLMTGAGVSLSALRRLSQVHGDRVVAVEGTVNPDVALLPPLGEADGMWSGSPDLALGILTADCVPVLLADQRAGLVAAVHAGWKGTLLQIVRVAVQRMTKAGGQPGQMVAALGPSIRRCCYQVEAPLAERFGRAFGEGVASPDGAAHARLELTEALRRTLVDAGLREDHIDILPHCTACDAERFFSHRRDGGRTGRMLSFIVAP